MGLLGLCVEGTRVQMPEVSGWRRLCLLARQSAESTDAWVYCDLNYVFPTRSIAGVCSCGFSDLYQYMNEPSSVRTKSTAYFRFSSNNFVPTIHLATVEVELLSIHGM